MERRDATRTRTASAIHVLDSSPIAFWRHTTQKRISWWTMELIPADTLEARVAKLSGCLAPGTCPVDAAELCSMLKQADPPINTVANLETRTEAAVAEVLAKAGAQSPGFIAAALAALCQVKFAKDSTHTTKTTKGGEPS
jgi:hypothetical protein